MADTTVQDILDTEDIDEPDRRIKKWIQDAQLFISAEWSQFISDNQSEVNGDLEEIMQRYLTLHISKVDNHPFTGESRGGKSNSYDTAQVDPHEWLKNTREGRYLLQLIRRLGGTATSPKGRTFSP